MVGLLQKAGFGPVSKVAAQFAPDPDFPTASFPNPEEPGVLAFAMADATRLGADVVLRRTIRARSRPAVAVPDPVTGSWRRLSRRWVRMVTATAY